MFRNDYIGNAPYVSSCPSLCHHELCPRDQFLVLSSDGLYQYFSNEEVVSHIESFMEKYPDGDPAQHLIEELLSRAAKKAGTASFLSSWEDNKFRKASKLGQITFLFSFYRDGFEWIIGYPARRSEEVPWRCHCYGDIPGRANMEVVREVFLSWSNGAKSSKPYRFFFMRMKEMSILEPNLCTKEVIEEAS